VVIPQLGQGNPVRNANWHGSKPSWVCVPIPVGLGTRRAAVIINPRQTAEIPSQRVRPRAPIVTDSIRGEKIGGTCARSIAAKYRSEGAIAIAFCPTIAQPSSFHSQCSDVRVHEQMCDKISPYSIWLDTVIRIEKFGRGGCFWTTAATVLNLRFRGFGMRYVPNIQNR
jgi:hypothetical protein